MKVIILNYLNVSVDILDAPDNLTATDGVEDYLQSLGYHIDSVNYMISEDEVPVYPAGVDETTFTPIVNL